MDIVNQEIERLNKLVMDFLFAVRPVKAELMLKDPSAILKNIIDFFSPEFGRAHVVVSLRMPEKSIRLLIDEKLFREVIINIAQNAFAAIKERYTECSEISESCRSCPGKIDFIAAVKGDNYVISIADNGSGIDEKDMDAVKTTTSKLTEKEKAKFEKNVTPILSPMYGIAVEKPVKPVVKVEESVMTETVKKSEPVKIPSPTIEDEIPEFSLDDILSTRDQEPKQEEDDLFGSTATSEFDFGNDDQLFPNLSFGDLEKETAEDSTTIISRSSLNDHSSHK